MSQEVAAAKNIGRAVKGLTSDAPLGEQIKKMRDASKSKREEVEAAREKAQKAENAKKAKEAKESNKKDKQPKQPRESRGSKKTGKDSSEGPINVQSERVNYPYVQKSLNAPRKAIEGPEATYKPSGPTPISPAGPSAKESAQKRANKAKRGTKNKSTMKVAEPVVDLESPTPKTIYNITDLPRQFRPNGNL